jgi:hypothetical protein
LQEEIRRVSEIREDLETFERRIWTSFAGIRLSANGKPSDEVDCDGLEAAAEAFEGLEKSLAAKWLEIQDRCERAVVRTRNLAAHEPLWLDYANVLDRALGVR